MLTVHEAASKWRVPPDLVRFAISHRALPADRSNDGQPLLHPEVVDQFHLSGSGQLRHRVTGQYVNHDDVSAAFAEMKHNERVLAQMQGGGGE
jgi:hypothetical protein